METEELNALQTARTKTLFFFYTYLRSVLCKDANESVGVGLQAPVKKARAQVLCPVRDLQGQLGQRLATRSFIPAFDCCALL